MTNSSDERISALMDGELDEPMHGDALNELLKKDEARDTWSRYHLISDTLRQQLPAGMDKQFSTRVMCALKDEPTVLAPTLSQASSLGQRLAGLAVAASVAAVAVMGVQFMYQQDPHPAASQIAQMPTTLSPSLKPSLKPSRPSASQTFARAAIRPNIQTVTQSANPSATNSISTISPLAKHFHPHLNKYLVDHNQQAPRAALQGVVPYARIVAYPNSRYTVIPAEK